jgi:hypothetical protein
MLCVYKDVLRWAGIVVPDSFVKDHQWWVWYGLFGVLEKYLKWATADLFARVMMQEELPPCPNWIIGSRVGPFRGAIASHLKRKLLFHKKANGKRSTNAINIAFSLYQGKAGSLPVTDEFVNEQVDAAIKRLTVDRTEELFPDRTEHDIDDFYDAITATVAEIFPKRRNCRCSRNLIPSMRSSYQSSRSQGGAFNWILCREESYFVKDYELYGFITIRGRWSSPEPFYGPDPDYFQELIEKSRLNALACEEVDCLPVGLLEPFKVRVITRGDADCYHLCRRYQRVIHPIMAKHPSCNLTRSPILQEHLDYFSERLRNEDAEGNDTFIVSGDYEAATDNLDPEISLFCLDSICERLGVPYQDHLVLRRSLINHRIHRKKGDAGLPQKWGQLMGSPISFPILCIVNLAITRLAMDRSGLWGESMADNPALHPARKLTSYPLLVNGDDVGFETNRKGYEVWKDLTRKVGLKFSLGKNYTHTDILILNSQIYERKKVVLAEFELEGKQRKIFRSVMTKVPHLEVGLLYGQVKGLCRESAEESIFSESPYLDQARSLAQMMGDLTSPHTDMQKKFLERRFITLNGDMLKKVPAGMSWFLPRRLGGLGLPVAEIEDKHVSDEQLKVAAYLATRKCDDGAMRDLLSPEIPSYLKDYMSALSVTSQNLGVRRIDVTKDEFKRGKDERAFTHLEKFAAHGIPTPETSYCTNATITRAFYSLKQKALATSLKSMKIEKALVFERYIIQESVSF